MASSSDTFGSKYYIYSNNINIEIIYDIFIQSYLLSNRIFPSYWKDSVYRDDKIRAMHFGKVLLKVLVLNQTQTAIGLKLN